MMRATRSLPIPRRARALALLAAVAGAATLGAACAARPAAPAAAPVPAAALVDAQATPETRALFANLRALAGRQILFGHQDDLAYGVTWIGEAGRSDVKDVTGAYPAVYGWDLGRLELGDSLNLDGVSFARMRGWIVDAYRRGGVTTLSWHLANPVSGGTSWDTTAAVPTVLPGGANHARYLQWLDRVADFALSLRATDAAGRSTLVPVIFRPYHEMSGGWFWWGRGRASTADYQALWRMTVEHLRDRRGVHNLLWAYSPNQFADSAATRYWPWYPGDAWVDVLGLDDYATLQGHTLPGDPSAVMAAQLRVLAREAAAHGKLAALTETGFEAVPDSTWFTRRLLAALDADSLTRRTAYVLVWRNANEAREKRRHFYAPYAGHPSAPDLVRFRASPLVAFEDELPPLYRMPGAR